MCPTSERQCQSPRVHADDANDLHTSKTCHNLQELLVGTCIECSSGNNSNSPMNHIGLDVNGLQETRTATDHDLQELFDPYNLRSFRIKSWTENQHELDTVRKHLWGEDDEHNSKHAKASDSMVCGELSSQSSLETICLEETLTPLRLEGIEEVDAAHDCAVLSLQKPYPLVRAGKRKKLYYP